MVNSTWCNAKLGRQLDPNGNIGAREMTIRLRSLALTSADKSPCLEIYLPKLERKRERRQTEFGLSVYLDIKNTHHWWVFFYLKLLIKWRRPKKKFLVGLSGNRKFFLHNPQLVLPGSYPFHFVSFSKRHVVKLG